MDYYMKKIELLNEKYRFKRRCLEDSESSSFAGCETEAMGYVFNPLTDMKYHKGVPLETLTTIQQDSEPIVEHPTISFEPTEQISVDSQVLTTLDPDISIRP